MKNIKKLVGIDVCYMLHGAELNIIIKFASKPGYSIGISKSNMLEIFDNGSFIINAGMLFNGDIDPFGRLEINFKLEGLF
jgi:hypothetical protein